MKKENLNIAQSNSWGIFSALSSFVSGILYSAPPKKQENENDLASKDENDIASSKNSYEVIAEKMGNKILDNFAEIKLLEEAYMGNLKEIYKLVDQGVNINYADEAGETALLVAARVGHYPIVAHLLKIGADANVKSKSGSTAVSSARSNDDWNMIRLLKAYGATANQSQFHVQSNIVGAGGGFGRGDEPIEQLVNNQNPTDEVLFTL